MAQYCIEPEQKTLHGHFSRDLPPILTIDSGDTIKYRTLDTHWGVIEHHNPFEQPLRFEPRDCDRDPGHALCGPIVIRDAKAGMTLEVKVNAIRTGTWGWSRGGGYPSAVNDKLGLAHEPPAILRWALHADEGRAINQFGHTISTRPFMGIMGMPDDEPGRHSTGPPRFCGGNLDCKELLPGSRLYLPIAVEGGLFSIGDGHAVQGDGEVSGVAIECPMELVEVELHLHENLQLSMPRANTPAGWITLGLHEDLDEALMMALEGMLDLMGELYPLERKEALAMASLLVDLRVTQIVNGVRGVHAVLPHGALNIGTT